jgi:hypothetical protein
VLPHWDNNYFLVGASIVAVIWHLRALWRANTSQNQQTYDTPETGVPCLVIVTRNRQYAVGLECAIIVLFIFFMANYGRLIVPYGFQSLTTARALTWISAIWMLFSYTLWDGIVSGKPLWPTRASPPREPYQHVREQEHAPTPLPSVKELSADLT